MTDTEIFIKKSDLEIAISKLSSLENGTGYTNNARIVMRSIGKTADAINEQFSELVVVENKLVELFLITKNVLTQAGIKFEQADLVSMAAISSIDGDVC